MERSGALSGGERFGETEKEAVEAGWLVEGEKERGPEGLEMRSVGHVMGLAGSWLCSGLKFGTDWHAGGRREKGGRKGRFGLIEGDLGESMRGMNVIY